MVFFVCSLWSQFWLLFLESTCLSACNSNSTGFLLLLFWYGHVFMQVFAGKGMGRFNPFGSLCRITTLIWWFSATAEWWLAYSSKQTVTLEWDLLSSDAYGHVTMKTFHWQNKVVVKESQLNRPIQQRPSYFEGFVHLCHGYFFIHNRWVIIVRQAKLTQTKRITGFYFFTPFFASDMPHPVLNLHILNFCIEACGEIPCLLHMATPVRSQASVFLVLWPP